MSIFQIVLATALSLSSFAHAMPPEIKTKLQCLVNGYPDHLAGFSETELLFKDGTRLPLGASSDQSNFYRLLDESEKQCKVPNGSCGKYSNTGMYPCALLEEIRQPFDDFLDQVSVLDMVSACYPAGKEYFGKQMPKNFDPGRVRSEAFFKKIYGSNSEEVRKNLVQVKDFAGRKTLSVSRVNRANEAFERISKELIDLQQKNPEMKRAIGDDMGGTFSWRFIAGTERLSGHSFGMTIDVAVKMKEYWQYSGQNPKDGKYRLVNSVPWEIVDIFERNGFVWGGKWHHFDTMHFEYRPELLDESCRCKPGELTEVEGKFGKELANPKYSDY